MPEASLAGRRVLVVEDEYMMASDLAEAFGSAGAQVIGPVPSVREAISMIGSQPTIDVAVLDLNLSGEMVFPAADVLVERGVRFLFTTGYDASVLPPRFTEILRLEKPVTAAAVVKATVALLQGEP